METAQSAQTVTVFPFTRLDEDGEVIIGRPETGTFLVLEPSAVEVLDWLADGSTIDEARHRYRELHGEPLNLQPFLKHLSAKGFVRLGRNGAAPDGSEAPDSDSTEGADGVRRFHLEAITPEAARTVFSTPALTGVGLLLAAAVLALIARPDLLPSWRALYFPDGLGRFGSALAVLSLLLVAVHELAHLVAARAVGVSCRFGFGTRLWVPVAETDMTGVWAVPRRKRYLPFLAGPLADATGAALCVLFLFAEAEGWLMAPSWAVRFAGALLLIYLLTILWQCYLFVRTDFYYVLANLLRCKNLMEDTRVFVGNLAARVLPWIRTRDQSHLPEHERRAVRWFSLAWLGGRCVAIAALVWIQLPLAWSYLVLLGGALTGSADTRQSPGTLFTAVLAVTTLALGLTLWIRSLYRRRR
ncbi:MAG: hypothetical protein PVG07_06610 [Acidobacteriota bacterium]